MLLDQPVDDAVERLAGALEAKARAQRSQIEMADHGKALRA